MKIQKRTARSALAWVVLLSALYSIIGEILFQTFYYHDKLLNYFEWWVILLSVAYTTPAVMLFRNRFWYFSVFILFFYVVFSIIFLFVFGAMFPITDDNPAGGILGIMIHGINIISFSSGTILGLLINISIHYYMRLNYENNIG
ncbi:hypothetical protein AB4114_29855 [Paenibacillus sp. 2RAB27]|uniref:hypothetical protein n=1 Tax=Paenibacillus sp. 2RAB27 TaxID=3232991 RepID=UPI003F97EF9E